MLEIQHLKKHFGKVTAVEDVSLQVAAGETVVLMGPSGCGKSTTIRTVNRLIEADGGSILFCGRNILHMNDEELRQVRKKIGFVFQQFNLISRLTAERMSCWA
jgi:polar amino acid transport system ATP-binding protein